MSSRMGISQIRALFYVFDAGTGVGHLRRLALIAKQLQGRFACLLVTGHRAAAHWFVPEECDYIHIPSWDNLLKSKSIYWNRQPFITLDEDCAVRLRRDIIKGVIKAFEPDVMFVDHLPLGAHNELADVIEGTACLKYLVTRGILNETENLRSLILGAQAHEYLKLHYHRILVAADTKVVNFSKHYNLSTSLREKTVHTGYVVEKVPCESIPAIREAHGVSQSDTWVVASAGGGQLGEPLIEACLSLVSNYKNIKFDIVVGPRSRLQRPSFNCPAHSTPNLRLHKDTDQMAHLHAGADLVISSAGYNSLLESMQGNAKILCFPYRRDRRDEQYRHAVALKSYVDIDVSTDLSDLPRIFAEAVRSVGNQKSPDRRFELDCAGAPVIEAIVLGDLSRNSTESITRPLMSIA